MHWCMQTRLRMLALLTDGGAGGDADDAAADADDADDEAADDDDAEAVMVLGCRGNWVRLTFDANCERWDQCALVVVNCDVADCQGCCGRNAAQIAAANVSWAAHEWKVQVLHE